MKHKPINLLMLFMALLTMFSWQVPAAQAQVPPDVINSFIVTVTPRADGTLDMRYDFDYTASTDFPSGDAWLEVGVPSNNFELTGFEPKEWVTGGRAIKGGKSQVHLDFAHLPKAGENFKFSFTIHQTGMANIKGEDVSFQLVPARFDFAEIKKLSIVWTLPEDASLTKNLSPEPANRNGATVTWTKENLRANEKFTVDLMVAKSAYPDLKAEVAPPANNPQSQPSGDNGGGALGLICLGILVAVGLVLLVIWLSGGFDGGSDSDDYTSTSTIGTYTPRTHDDSPSTPRRSSSCACVSSCVSSPRPSAPSSHRDSGGSSSYSGRSSSCVSTPSCACACACAGSGRAGCSEKGFGIKRLLAKMVSHEKKAA